MTNKFYIIDAARYPLVLSDNEELPRDVIPLLLRTKQKASYAQGPFLLSESAINKVDEWFFTEDLYDVVCFHSKDQDIRTFEDWCVKMFDVETDDGHEYFFRYYDSRVIRMFLPLCDSNQLNEFFNNISSVTIYSEDYLSAMKYSTANGQLVIEQIEFGEGTNSLGLKKIKFPLPTLSQLKCLNKLKANQNEMSMKYGSKIERIDMLIQSQGKPSLIHAEIERITGRNLTMDSAIENNSKPLKGRASRLRAKSYAAISEKNKLRTKLERPVVKAKAKLRANDPFRKAANLKNAKQQEVQTAANKAKLKAMNKSGLTAGRTNLNKGTSEMETLKNRGSKLDNVASNKLKSKVMNQTSQLREVEDAVSKPTSINQAITKVNKLQKMASDKKKEVDKATKTKKESKEETKEVKKKEDDKPKWDLDF